jgi:hypothetical protein
MSLLTMPAWAQANSVAQCSGIADPSARLACYDAAQPPRATPVNPGATRYPEFNSSPRIQTPPPIPNTASGGSALTRGRLIAAVVSYRLSPSGRFTIVLDNGQTWKQVDSDDGVAQFRKEGRNVVAITKGFLWSYDLKLNAMSAIFKVTRVN